MQVIHESQNNQYLPDTNTSYTWRTRSTKHKYKLYMTQTQDLPDKLYLTQAWPNTITSFKWHKYKLCLTQALPDTSFTWHNNKLYLTQTQAWPDTITSFKWHKTSFTSHKKFPYTITSFNWHKIKLYLTQTHAALSLKPSASYKETDLF